MKNLSQLANRIAFIPKYFTVILVIFLLVSSCTKEDLLIPESSNKKLEDSFERISKDFSLKKDTKGIIKKENAINFESEEQLRDFLSKISMSDTVKTTLNIKKKDDTRSAHTQPYYGDVVNVNFVGTSNSAGIYNCFGVNYWAYEYNPITNTYNYVQKFNTRCGLGTLNAYVYYGVETTTNSSQGTQTQRILPGSLNVQTSMSGITFSVSSSQGLTQTNYFDSAATFSTTVYINWNLFFEGVGTIYTQIKTVTGGVNVNGYSRVEIY